MRVNLHAQGVQDAIKPGGAEYCLDRMALAAILQGVPSEMLASLATKNTARSAWEAIKIMQMGGDCVQEVRVKTLHCEFEAIRMKETETVDDFSMWMNGLVNNIRSLGDSLEEEKVVKKFLRVVPQKFS